MVMLPNHHTTYTKSEPLRVSPKAAAEVLADAVVYSEGQSEEEST